MLKHYLLKYYIFQILQLGRSCGGLRRARGDGRCGAVARETLTDLGQVGVGEEVGQLEQVEDGLDAAELGVDVAPQAPSRALPLVLGQVPGLLLLTADEHGPAVRE